MKKTLLISFLSLGILSTSCKYTKIGDVTVVSTRNFESKAEYVEIARYVRAKGKAKRGTFALENAIDNAVKSVPGGEFMKNCKVSVRNDKVKVEGDVWGYKK